MFQKARLKLTGWYLLILTMIVVLFSVTIYRLLDVEITRVASAQRNRVERWQILMPPSQDLPPLIFFDENEVADLRQRLIMMLAIVDTAIVIIAGGLGYLLAGKTLIPIEEVMSKQEQFVADSSHELRTPLTALRTSMEVALRDKGMTDNVAREVIGDNLKEVVRLQSLAENLLELTRSGKTLKLNAVKLEESLENAYQQVKTIAAAKKIEIKIPKRVGVVIAHPLAIERVLVIVLDNAIKYSNQRTTIKITARAVKKEMVLTIIDQGKGIAADQIEKIFERFYRGDSARSNTIPGYGLGLAIAKELMIAQKGAIEIESKDNVGTKVKIKLPISA